MNRVGVIGTGYVGLVTGTCLSEFGMNVICMDKDTNKINMLNNLEIPIYEPGLLEIVKKNYTSNRLSFTSDIEYVVKNTTTIFIAVGTPPKEDGSADLSYVLAAAKEIAQYLDSYHVIVNKSTVPVGTARKVKETISNELKKLNKNIEFDVVSNPEFLREGAAVRDFMHPDRIVIGVESKRAEEVMKSIYSVLYLINRPFVITNLETAELIKYASNAFLATKISFINEMANLCECVNADINHVSLAMGLDGRIGKYFLHPGPGYGGSCFPKDTLALAKIARDNGSKSAIIEAVVEVNKLQKIKMIKKIEKIIKNFDGKTIAVLGLSFKPETDDIRESPSLVVIKELINRGCKIKAYDPVAIENTQGEIPNSQIEYTQDEYNACENSDAVVIMTEWNQFRYLNLDKIKSIMKVPIFFDFRNIYDPKILKEKGFIYDGVGRN